LKYSRRFWVVVAVVLLPTRLLITGAGGGVGVGVGVGLGVGEGVGVGEIEESGVAVGSIKV